MSSLISSVKGRMYSLAAGLQYSYWSHRRWGGKHGELSFAQAVSSFSAAELHVYFHSYFHHRLPRVIVEHRDVFRGGEGFGEDALHAMWFLLIIQEKPENLLEIGVYRGQVITLWALIGKYLNSSMAIHAISPFSDVGDSVSNYAPMDYEEAVLDNIDLFDLPQPTLIKALSSDEVARQHVQSRIWDLIYIDGSHEYEDVLGDYEMSQESLKPGGLLVMDDVMATSLPDSSFKAPLFSSGGHPGPSRVVRERTVSEMEFIASVGHNAIFRKR